METFLEHFLGHFWSFLVILPFLVMITERQQQVSGAFCIFLFLQGEFNVGKQNKTNYDRYVASQWLCSLQIWPFLVILPFLVMIMERQQQFQGAFCIFLFLQGEFNVGKQNKTNYDRYVASQWLCSLQIWPFLVMIMERQQQFQGAFCIFLFLQGEFNVGKHNKTNYDQYVASRWLCSLKL